MSPMPMDRRQFLRGTTTALGGLALGGLVVGCGSSENPGTPAADPTAGPTVDPNASVEDLAKAEDGLLFYANATDYHSLLAGFMAAYPWANTSISVGTPGDMLAKVQTEHNANAPTADVVLANAAQRAVLVNEGLLQPAAEVPNVDLYPDEAWADPDGMTFTFSAEPRILIYNTNLIGDTPPVEDVFELIEPQWRDKLVFDRPQNVGTAAWWLSSQRETWGDDKWMEWLEGLKANNAQIVGSASAGFQAMVAGEHVICVSTIRELRNNPDAPAEANFTANMVMSPLMLGIPTRASSPNTASLFMNWVLSPEGQATVVEGLSANPVIGSTMEEDLNLPEHAFMSPPSVNQGFIDDPDSYLEVFNEFWPA